MASAHFSMRMGRTVFQGLAGLLVVMIHGHFCLGEKSGVNEKALAF